MDSNQHLFFECSFVQKVWNDIKKWLGITRRLSNLNALLQWCRNHGGGRSKRTKAIRIYVAAVVYYVWALSIARSLRTKHVLPRKSYVESKHMYIVLCMNYFRILCIIYRCMFGLYLDCSFDYVVWSLLGRWQQTYFFLYLCWKLILQRRLGLAG